MSVFWCRTHACKQNISMQLICFYCWDCKLSWAKGRNVLECEKRCLWMMVCACISNNSAIIWIHVLCIQLHSNAWRPYTGGTRQQLQLTLKSNRINTGGITRIFSYAGAGAWFAISSDVPSAGTCFVPHHGLMRWWLVVLGIWCCVCCIYFFCCPQAPPATSLAYPLLFIVMLLFLAFLLGYLFHTKRSLGERVHFITTSIEINRKWRNPVFFILLLGLLSKLGYWLQP